MCKFEKETKKDDEQKNLRQIFKQKKTDNQVESFTRYT